MLVGWSMGGRVIRQYLMMHGDARLAGINFVASQVIEDPRCRGPAAPKPPPEDQTLAAEIDAAIAFLDGCYGRKPSEADFRRALAYNMQVPAAVRRAIAGWSTDATQTIDALRRVRVPILITHGRDDTVVLPAAADMTAAAIPHARQSWFDGCGHSPFCEDAPRFNVELLAFVRSCQGRRPRVEGIIASPLSEFPLPSYGWAFGGGHATAARTRRGESRHALADHDLKLRSGRVAFPLRRRTTAQPPPI